LITHESFHAEEMHIIGFDKYVKDAPLRGTLEVDYTNENWIRFYKREKYVHDRILKSKKNVFNSEELRHNYFNYDYYLIQLENRKIKIPE
jgi:hypothetical protein